MLARVGKTIIELLPFDDLAADVECTRENLASMQTGKNTVTAKNPDAKYVVHAFELDLRTSERVTKDYIQRCLLQAIESKLETIVFSIPKFKKDVTPARINQTSQTIFRAIIIWLLEHLGHSHTFSRITLVSPNKHVNKTFENTLRKQIEIVRNLLFKTYTEEIHYAQLKALAESYLKSKVFSPTESFVLDAGCGSRGHLLSTNAADAYLIGLDISRESIRRAVKRTRAYSIGLDLNDTDVKKASKRSKAILRRHFFLVGDIEKLPFRHEIFHAIVCCDVLEHLHRHKRVAKEFGSCIKKEGMLFLATTNAWSLTSLIDQVLPKKLVNKLLRSFKLFFYERAKRTNPIALKSILGSEDLKVVKMLTNSCFIIWRRLPKLLELLRVRVLYENLTNLGSLRFLKEEIVVVAKKRARMTDY